MAVGDSPFHEVFDYEANLFPFVSWTWYPTYPQVPTLGFRYSYLNFVALCQPPPRF